MHTVSAREAGKEFEALMTQVAFRIIGRLVQKYDGIE